MSNAEAIILLIFSIVGIFACGLLVIVLNHQKINMKNQNPKPYEFDEADIY